MVDIQAYTFRFGRGQKKTIRKQKDADIHDISYKALLTNTQQVGRSTKKGLLPTLTLNLGPSSWDLGFRVKNPKP